MSFMEMLNQDPLPLLIESKPIQHIWDNFIPTARNGYKPHVLGHRSLVLLSVLLIVVKVATISLLTIGPILPSLSSAISPDNVLALTNSSRQANNLSGLTMNDRLTTAATNKANDMLAKQYFAHVTPDNKQPWDFITAAGYAYQGAGENLAVGFLDAESLENGWMNSPGHRANILNSNFKEIGIGIAQGQFQGQQATLVVQMFGMPQAVAKAPVLRTSVAPAPVPKAIAKKPVAKAAPKKVVAKAPVKKKVAVKKPVKKVAGVETDIANEVMIPLPELKIIGADLEITNNNILISVATSESAAQVVAQFGNQAILLTPRSDNLWQGQIPASELMQNPTLNVHAAAYDGQHQDLRLADFSPNLATNYNDAAAPEPRLISILGLKLDPMKLANEFYLCFIAIMLSLLVLTIGIRAKIQHISLIANTSFVIMFATLLWYTGIIS